MHSHRKLYCSPLLFFVRVVVAEMSLFGYLVVVRSAASAKLRHCDERGSLSRKAHSSVVFMKP